MILFSAAKEPDIIFPHSSYVYFSPRRLEAYTTVLPRRQSRAASPVAYSVPPYRARVRAVNQGDSGVVVCMFRPCAEWILEP